MSAPRRPAPAPPPSVHSDRLIDRLFEPVETGATKVVLAVVWVFAQLLALAAGVVALAVLFGGVAAAAALHAARAWRRAGLGSSRAVAGAGTLAVVLAAAGGATLAGAALILVVVAACTVAIAEPGRGGMLVTAGTTVRCTLAPALAATSVVLLGRISWSAAGALLLLVAAYDLAAYVWGADGSGPLVGRIAGFVTVLVLTFSLSVVQLVFSLEPFATPAAVWVFGGLAATLCPLGQLVASAMLPAAAADAPALRRIDALLLAGPAWLWALWGYLG